ncbi:HAD hydrolase-like protein [Shewanella rhizosphaerae]|uniref:HAD family hydrolase n=1 Tax=Shewanella TaxID=22 RepID=UPI001C65FDFE|nr:MULTISPECIES: HAD hydrolase-like protein [Shewanella]QYJ97062.1 HAD hydrolase-like protein [Shewanella alkalitolerans]QYK12314.1 HAD hydrolase-like protein [Shewanella rhizosphaerae]
MKNIYLFDWGDTLMVDFPCVHGKMCDWETVEAVEGALEALRHLSKSASIYIATGAAESSESDIQLAFERVGLAQFITGYFCKANLGVSKGNPDFLPKIIDLLGVDKALVFMVGDSLAKDIEPALKSGIQPIWYNPKLDDSEPKGVKVIQHLTELCI